MAILHQLGVPLLSCSRLSLFCVNHPTKRWHFVGLQADKSAKVSAQAKIGDVWTPKLCRDARLQVEQNLENWLFLGCFCTYFCGVLRAGSRLFWLRLSQGPWTRRLPDCPSPADGSEAGRVRRVRPALMSGMAIWQKSAIQSVFHWTDRMCKTRTHFRCNLTFCSGKTAFSSFPRGTGILTAR
jgi:hypothetical protein